MGDSDDERNSRRNRDKFKRERHDSDARASYSQPGPGFVQRDYHLGMKTDEPPSKRPREYGNGTDFTRKHSRRDEETRTSQTSVALPKQTPSTAKPLVISETTPMMTLKQFLMTQDDHINDEEAMVKYRQYKEEYLRQQLKNFFQAHKDEPWFIEKYHPTHHEVRSAMQAETVRQRLQTFMKFYHENKLPVAIDCGVQMKSVKKLIHFMDSVVILLEGGTDNDLRVLDEDSIRKTSSSATDHNQTPISSTETSPLNENGLADDTFFEMKSSSPCPPRPLHKTNSIYLRTLAPTLSRKEIEEICKAHPGFKRLALQDPLAELKFFRRGWATYSVESSSSIKEICWKVNNVRIKDTELGAIVNRELSQRVRPVSALTHYRGQMLKDLKEIIQLVRRLDERRNLWTNPEEADGQNPLLLSAMEHLTLQDSSKEDALCNLDKQSSQQNGTEQAIDMKEDGALRQVFDSILLYLRIVHSIDYYSAVEYAGEDEMPHKCGIIHARGLLEELEQPVTKQRLEDFMKEFDAKLERLYQSLEPLSEAECKRLGLRDPEAAVEVFIKDNIQELAKDRWLCPLSGKKFKGPEFVRKHIETKHGEKLDAERNAVLFFNNYVRDRHRPQPQNPPSTPSTSTTNGDPSRAMEQNKFARNADPGRREEGGFDNGRILGEGRYSGGRGNDNGNDGSMDNRRFNGGRHFRGGNYRGGQPFRPREGFVGRGRYSDRAIISYVDLDAPPKD